MPVDPNDMTADQMQGPSISPEDAALVAAEAADKAGRDNPGITMAPGTIVAVTATTSTQYTTALVHVDGDDPSNTTEAVSLIGNPTVGGRVMVMFVPPQGVYLIGSFGGCNAESITFTAFAGVTSVPSPPWPPRVDSIAFEVVVECTGVATTDTDIEISVDGVVVFDFTFGAGESELVLDASEGVNFAMPQFSQVVVTFVTVGSGLRDCTVTINYCPGGQIAVPE